MGTIQDMSQHLGRTQLSAQKRLGRLAEMGHAVSLSSDKTHAVATITCSDGELHHIIITPAELTRETREGNPFRRHPQSVLLAHAIHAICDWNDNRQDISSLRRCRECTSVQGTVANYNMQESRYDWYCPTCFYGEAA